jgi:hypothetical protein
MAQQSHIEQIKDAASPLSPTDSEVIENGKTHQVFFDVDGESVCVAYSQFYDHYVVLSGRIDAPGPEDDYDDLNDAIAAMHDYPERFRNHEWEGRDIDGVNETV